MVPFFRRTLMQRAFPMTGPRFLRTARCLPHCDILAGLRGAHKGEIRDLRDQVCRGAAEGWLTATATPTTTSAAPMRIRTVNGSSRNRAPTRTATTGVA